jgi:phage repressor protein C with HTH and peptisase S24 domain
MDIQENRRARLREWLKDRTAPAKEKSYFSQLVGGIASFGERAARRIERDYGMGDGYLDKTSSESTIAPVEVPKSDDKSPVFTKMRRETGVKLTDGRSFVNIRPVLEWDNESELGEEYVLIPRLDIKVSAGNGRIVWDVDEKGQKQAFRASWIARLGINPGQAATVVADGSSMEPRVIDGDSLVVDYKATNLIDGKVYVLAYQNEVYVKRLFKRPGGGLTIRSDNPDKARYPDMEVLPPDAEHVEIIARVVAVSGAM